MTAGLCEAAHDQPRSAMPGQRVCVGHGRAAANALASLPVIHANLENYLHPSSTGSGGAGYVSASRDPGLRLDTAVAAARADISECLTRWAAYGTSRLDEHGPTRRDLTTIAAWIANRITWYFADQRAADFAVDLADTARRARAQRQHNHAATFEVGPCPEPDCDGTLITRLRPADSLLPSVIWCDKSPLDQETGLQLHIWPAGEGWHTLGRKIHHRAIQ